MRAESVAPLPRGRPLALFDLDGTLTDPAPGITGCLRFALESLGHDPVNHEPLERFIGPPLQETFESMGVDASAAIEAYRERFATVGIFENRVYDDIPEALQMLAERGWQLAVATSKPEIFANRIVDHFGLADWFDTVTGATLDGTRRHKADIVGEALDRLQATDRPAVMIGDRSHDILGGRAHGLPAIGVSWGYGSRDELEHAGALAIADTPLELPALLPDA
jgi:phosphoglycolate phosphatase